MHVEIVSPEATLYSGEISSVTAPGTDGSFQVLSAHAPLVAALGAGEIKIQGVERLQEEQASRFTSVGQGAFSLSIQSGTLEVKNNTIIVLAD